MADTSLPEQVQSALTRHAHGRTNPGQWHAAESTMITKVMPYGGARPPACESVMGAGDENRTRTISLGI
jgi:hypothetical protein